MRIVTLLGMFLAAFLLPPGPLAAAEAPANEIIPVELFGDLPFLSDPVLSPDGTRIAAKVYIDGRPQIGIWSADNPSGSAPRLISPGENDSVDFLRRIEAFLARHNPA